MKKLTAFYLGYKAARVVGPVLAVVIKSVIEQSGSDEHKAQFNAAMEKAAIKIAGRAKKIRELKFSLGEHEHTVTYDSYVCTTCGEDLSELT